MDAFTLGERIALLRKKNGYTHLSKTLGVTIDQLLEDSNNDYWETQIKKHFQKIFF